MRLYGLMGGGGGGGGKYIFVCKAYGKLGVKGMPGRHLRI